MKWLKNLFRRIFLVKEIISSAGEVHFRRYRLLQTSWFAIYIHQILKSDEENHFHDHPWNFESLIIKGSYWEQYSLPPSHWIIRNKTYYPGDVVKRQARDAHKITLQSPEVWTLVFTSGRERVWGYQTENGWLDFKTYRQLKNEGKI